MIIYDNKERLENNVRRGYTNRSKLYLFEALKFLKSYKEIETCLSKLVVMGVGLNGVEGILLVFNVERFNQILSLIEVAKQNNELVDEMIIDINHHAIIFKSPVNLNAFERGLYTEIYTPEQLKRINPNCLVYPILKKDTKYFKTFVNFMKSCFSVMGSYPGEDINESLLKDYQQYDIPPCLNQEVFWYRRFYSSE